MKIDLHIHSANSDGADTIKELIPKIKQAGLDVFALTDHDRTDGWKDAAKLANKHGLSFIPGVEITTEGRHPDGKSFGKPFGIHLLAYLPDPNNKQLVRLLKQLRKDRIRRAKRYVKNIRRDFPSLRYRRVLQLAQKGSTIGRPDIVNALWELKDGPGYASKNDYFNFPDSPISKTSRHYVRNEAPDVLDVIRIVRNAGGVPVIAHPLARTSSEDVQPETFPRAHFEAMVEAGLLGLETKHLEVDQEVTRPILEAFAAQHGLITTGSSDYHGLEVKPDNPLGLNTTSVEMLKKILLLGTGVKPTLNHEF
jgi:predicted metal-dependent phosphoesterase TrpH